MRPVFLLFVAASSLMSCTSTHIHLTTFAPPQGYTGEKPHIRQHEAVTVEYDFSMGGNQMGFQVQNRMNQDIFIDFSRSSLIVNDLSLPYYHGTMESVTQIQTTNMPFWTENLSLMNMTGTTSGGTMGSVVMIPAGTRVHFQRIEVPVPLLPFQKRELEQGLSRYHPASVSAKVGSTYRHRLAFVPENPANEPFYVEDEFVIINDRLVTGGYFQTQRAMLMKPESLTSVRGVETIDTGATVMGLLATLVGTMLILTVTEDGN